ncbi:MAG TPA: SMC-Scp complex subunit ScpB [bacterium]|nr:SMC-Scp complex subunit ScpB [bacterium]
MEPRQESIYNQVLAVLFVEATPVERKNLTSILDIKTQELAEAIRQGNEHTCSKVFFVQEAETTVQLATRPAYSQLIQKWLKQEDKAELTASARETLAIIAYRQPVSRSDIESIRGLDSRKVLKNLLERGLIQFTTPPENGDPKAYYYELSLKFLEYFGLGSIEELRAKIVKNEG